MLPSVTCPFFRSLIIKAPLVICILWSCWYSILWRSLRFLSLPRVGYYISNTWDDNSVVSVLSLLLCLQYFYVIWICCVSLLWLIDLSRWWCERSALFLSPLSHQIIYFLFFNYELGISYRYPRFLSKLSRYSTYVCTLSHLFTK